MYKMPGRKEQKNTISLLELYKTNEEKQKADDRKDLVETVSGDKKVDGGKTRRRSSARKQNKSKKHHKKSKKHRKKHHNKKSKKHRKK